ncbi:hypothetical protein PF010_g23135 [Phytophthora fragariae]|uniref:Uncharacterized protein n=1 Tax=Phytophthora fragariae TaxID=53985 RepID=A0A6G0K6V3_9STRA|nr:hypothetical protein PF003_g21173 [Phytophthora fragariae]KAE9078401.1 hypothetical protein PF010_g23135 [Phytophthora fragariae]
MRCKHCVAVHKARSYARKFQSPTHRVPDSPDPPKIVGRIENFRRHLQRYHDIVEPVEPTRAPTVRPPTPWPPIPRQQLPVPDLSRGTNRQGDEDDNQERHASLPADGSLADVYRRVYSPQQQREFERFLLEFKVALALPDSYVEHPATIRLFQFLNPQCVASLPSRRVLGGRVLDAFAKEFIELSDAVLRKLQETTGGRVNLLSDVWQNIVKTHLLGVHLSLFGRVFIEGMHATGSEHDGVALARQMNQLAVIRSQKLYR